MKLILTIKSGSLGGRSFELTAGHLLIGRSANCSIRFDPMTETIASSQHAFLEAKADGFYISDNNSTNGTYVNGQRAQNAKLASGDVLQFGTNGIEASVLIEGSTVQVQAQSENATVPFASYNPVDAEQLSHINRTFEKQQTQNLTISESVSTLGLGRFAVEPQENNTGKYIGIGITLFVIVFLGLIVTGIMFLSLGPVAAVVAAVVAFAPAIVYLLPLIWLDRYDPEPVWLLALTFTWGALVAVFLSFIINTVIGTTATVAAGQQVGTFVGAVISAPIFEELTKGAGLLVIVLFFRRYFDGILDGIIFAGVIALGFATVENVLYYGRAILSNGLPGLVIIFFMRGILSPFAHVTFTAMTGIGFGISRESHNPIIKYGMPFVGLGCAIFLHAFWNGVAVMFGGGFLIVYLIIEIPFFFIFVGFAFYIMYRQNKILKEMLAIDVARGLVPQEDFERATSAFRSTAWLVESIFSGKYRATSRYIRAIGKLGLSYWHIQRATAAQGETASFQQNPVLREEVLKWRDQV